MTTKTLSAALTEAQIRNLFSYMAPAMAPAAAKHSDRSDPHTWATAVLLDTPGMLAAVLTADGSRTLADVAAMPVWASTWHFAQTIAATFAALPADFDLAAELAAAIEAVPA